MRIIIEKIPPSSKKVSNGIALLKNAVLLIVRFLDNEPRIFTVEDLDADILSKTNPIWVSIFRSFEQTPFYYFQPLTHGVIKAT